MGAGLDPPPPAAEELSSADYLLGLTVAQAVLAGAPDDLDSDDRLNEA